MKLYKFLPVIFLLQSLNLSAQATDSVVIDGRAFTKVEIEAGFPGGENGWRSFLMKNLNANIPVDNDAPSGKFTIIVKFAIAVDGSLSDVAAETNLGYGMEQEVIRLIKKSGKWSPAIKDGKPIKAYRRQPVTFLVEQEDGYEIMTKNPFTLLTGADNEITVKVKKISSSNLTVSASRGIVTPLEDGKFNLKIDSPGRVIVTVYNKKNNQKLCAASYEVK